MKMNRIEMKMLLTLTIILCIVHQFIPTIALAICKSESLEEKCTVITNCENILEHIKDLHSSNSIGHFEYITGYVRNITCGFDGETPKICCSNDRKIVKRSLNYTNGAVRKPNKIIFPDEFNLAESDTTTKVNQDAINQTIHNNNSKGNLNNLSAACGNFIWNKNLNADDQPTDLDDFPWLALLEYDTNTGKRIGCGGVLISNRYVLTAAHCINPPLNLVSVRLGEHDLNMDPDCSYEGLDISTRYCANKSIIVGIEKLIPHKNYNFTRDPNYDHQNSYDIGLIHLNRDVISDFIKPICLPSETPTIKGRFLSAGWGAAPNNTYLRSSVKRMAKLIGVNDKDCDQQYVKHLRKDVLCAKSKILRTACISDSGGPLMSIDVASRMTVEGLFSPVSDEFCLINGMPGTYTSVRKYINWIKANM